MKMKKVLLCTLAIIMAMTCFSYPAMAEELKVTLDGKEIECVDANGASAAPLLIDGTTYLPVRAVSNALGVSIAWDNDTRSVFIDGTPEKAEKGDNINIFIKGVRFTASDVTGKVVNPIINNDSVYLPIRAIGTAFDKNVFWDGNTKTASLVTPTFMELDTDKTYAIINKAGGKAISVTDSGLAAEKYGSYTYQAFKFIPTDISGYYFINSVSNGKNLDVNGNSSSPGANIITYNAGKADNQKFAALKTDDGVIIYARSSKLPIEDSAGRIKQNSLRESIVQKWEIVETTPVEKNVETKYYTVSANIGGSRLYLVSNSDTNLAAASLPENDSSSESALWEFDSDPYGQYIITSRSTSKSLDVANNSTKSGDPIIAYTSSGDQNQRWTLEQNENGTYKIKSVHSSLYLAIENGSVIQSDIGTDWSIE